MTNAWKPGQEVILNGRIVTIERVTLSGIVVIGADQFDRKGFLRGFKRAYFGHQRPCIVDATPERRAEIARRTAAEAAEDAAYKALERMRDWMRLSKPGGWIVPDRIPIAHALTDAINTILDNAEKEAS